MIRVQALRISHRGARGPPWLQRQQSLGTIRVQAGIARIRRDDATRVARSAPRRPSARASMRPWRMAKAIRSPSIAAASCADRITFSRSSGRTRGDGQSGPINQPKRGRPTDETTNGDRFSKEPDRPRRDGPAAAVLIPCLLPLRTGEAPQRPGPGDLLGNRRGLCPLTFATRARTGRPAGGTVWPSQGTVDPSTGATNRRQRSARHLCRKQACARQPPLSRRTASGSSSVPRQNAAAEYVSVLAWSIPDCPGRESSPAKGGAARASAPRGFPWS